MLRSVATVGSLTMVSRVLGLVRDMLLAAVLGASPLADAFFVAFKLPNFLRRLFAEGAFNAGFVPVFSSTLESEGKDKARVFAERAQAIQVAVLVPLVVVAVAAMPWLLRGVLAGYDPGSDRFQGAVELSRITFVYILFISLVALYGGMLNSVGKFAAAAAAPILLNLCLIAGMLLSRAWLGAPARTLAWSVAAAGAVQLLWLVAAAHRQGLGLRARRPRLTPEVRRLFALVLPGAFGAGVAQVSLFADLFFASMLPAGALSYLFFADRLSQLPLGVIGVAVGTALLPLMVRQLRAGEEQEAVHSQNRAIEVSLLLTLPAAIGLAELRDPILEVLLQRGEFGAAERAATSPALATYCLGLPAYVLIKVLSPGFFARQDVKTPVKVAVACLVVNLLAALALIGPLRHVGIALANVISSWLNAGLLATGLYRQGLFKADRRLRRRVPRMLLAGGAMFLLLRLLRSWVEPLPPLLALVVLVGSGALAFAAAGQLLGAVDLRELKHQLRARKA